MNEKVTFEILVNDKMQPSEENAQQPALDARNQTSPYLKSPIPILYEQNIDTPQKLPSAPHPSPINMVADINNPKSKETFRTELLKACLLKLPEAVGFDEYLCGRLSTTTSESLIPKEGESECVVRVHKKAKFDGKVGECHLSTASMVDQNVKICRQETLDETDVFADAQDSVNVINVGVCDGDEYSTLEKKSNICQKVNIKEALVEMHADGQPSSEIACSIADKFGGNQDGYILPYLVNVSEAKQSYLNAESITIKYATNNVNDQLDIFDHRTNYQDISRLLNVASVYSDCPSRGRSPCSDNLSTVAVCASDASDMSDEDSESTDFGRSLDHPRKKIADEDFEESSDSRGFEMSVDRSSKKKPKSAMRRFLNWRRCLKMRKRAASLDESRFPFLANSIDSYKTEFELSV